MLNFFDYLYYKACEYYSRGGEKDAAYSGLLVVAAMHCFNILSVIFIINLITHTKVSVSKYYWIGVAILLLILNGLRYTKYKYAILKERWVNEEESVKKRRRTILTPYIILSTALCFGLAIYLGSKKW
jgi:hypothetical protein